LTNRLIALITHDRESRLDDQGYLLAALIARVALGDRAAFSDLYDRTSPKLFAVCLRIVRDRAEAEDALQDAFVRIWRRSSTWRAGETSPLGWLCAIARNCAVDRMRSRERPAADFDEALEIADPDPGPEASAMMAGELQRIELCLGELPDERAQAVRAAYVEGYSYQELAERFGVPINTMRTWLHRSLRALRACLER
jgi:RNA polymerase sigma-70 factor, ECF subfamily